MTASIGEGASDMAYNYYSNSEDRPMVEEVDPDDQEWDSLPRNKYIDYEVFFILEETNRLLAERAQTLDALNKQINALKEKNEFLKVYPLEIQLGQLKRELSDEVINSKLNILKNLMKEELQIHEKDSLRSLELNGWIQAIRDFQRSQNLPFKIKVLTNVISAASNAAFKTSEKVAGISSEINSKLTRLGVYTALNDWGFAVKDQVNDTFQAINPFCAEPKPAKFAEEKE